MTNSKTDVKYVTKSNKLKIFSILGKIVLPVMALVLVFSLSQTALASGTFRVTAGVHVRSSESAQASSLTTVNEGTSVDVLEHNPAGWSKVQVGSTTGYIRSDFLKLSIGDNPVSFRVTTGVHVRASASTSASSLTTVNEGSSVDVLEHNPAGWSKVQVGGTTGYIRSDFLKHTGTASASSSGSGGSASAAQRQTKGNVNLRSSASTTSSILKTLPNGTVVDVLDSETSGWSKVSYSGDTGYIRSDLLESVSSSAQSETQTRYTTGNVNLRKSASTSAGIIRTLSQGTSVEVISNETNGWSKVSHNGDTGYIRSDLLTASSQGDSQTRYTDGNVNLRSSASTSSSILRTLSSGTAVEVLGTDSGWSRVSHNNSTGYIRSDLLLSSPPASSGPVGVMQTTTGVNVRSGPSTGTQVLTTLVGGSSVEVLAHESNGWSKVKTGNINGYIRSDLLHIGSPVELVTMAEITHLLPTKQNIRIVDVRTGTSFNIRIFSKGLHADYDTATKADTDAMFATRNGVRSWAARPVWVYVGNRVFAASTHGMPHAGSSIAGNGVDGHFCLHFHNTVTNSKTYQADLRRAVQEAYDKRPR